MSMIRSGQAQSSLPEDFGAALDLVIQAKSVAAQTSVVIGTNRQKIAFPLWVADPSVGWYNEPISYRCGPWDLGSSHYGFD